MRILAARCSVPAGTTLCKKHGTTPRGVYQQHLPELQEIVFGRNEHARDPKPQ
jgi:hypothetical protein